SGSAARGSVRRGRGGGTSGPWRGGRPARPGSDKRGGASGGGSSERARHLAPPEKLIARQARNSLIPVLEATGVDPHAAIDRLRAFGMLLLEWSRHASNLISQRDEPRLLERHIRESIV